MSLGMSLGLSKSCNSCRLNFHAQEELLALLVDQDYKVFFAITLSRAGTTVNSCNNNYVCTCIIILGLRPLRSGKHIP